MPILFPPCVNIRLTSPVTVASVFSQILWWIVGATEAVVLVRSGKAKLYGKYPAFYLYLSTVFFLELIRFSVFHFRPTSYSAFYWYTEFLAASVGYAVILEIYNHALKSSPGAASIARTFLLLVLGAVILRVVANALSSPVWSPAATSTELERGLRTVQALLLLGIVVLLAYYWVPVGRNVKGITLGYGFYICASVVSLAFGSLPGYALHPAWRHVQPIAYLAALFIWCWALWSYQPNPESETQSKMDRDYRFLVDKTKRIISTALSFLKLGSEL